MSDLDNELRKLKHYVETNSKRVELLVSQLVTKYNRDLDDFLNTTRDLLNQRERLTTTEIENLTIKVPIYAYFASEGVENLGIELDNMKAIKSQRYNDAYMEADGTIGDKKALAENETLTEGLMEVVYTRAYKKLKTKVDLCESIAQSARKVLTKRITEIEINRGEPNYEKDI